MRPRHKEALTALRVAQLTKYGRLAASTRQRFDQYGPYMTAVDCEPEPWPLLDDRYLSELYENGRRNIIYLSERYFDRIAKIVLRNDVDLLWVHCELLPFFPDFIEKIILLRKKPIVFDYDDAIFHNYDQHQNPLIRALFRTKLKTILSTAEVAFCGNGYLADYARRYCRNVEIVPSVVDTNIFSPGHRPSNAASARIGWIGTPSTWREFMVPMMPLLTAVADAEGARVTAVGAGAAATGHSLLDSLPWSEQTEVARIRDMDVGVMPLADTPWARGKCGYKLIQYMACGLPVVASPVGVNSTIVEHGVNGFLAETAQQWKEALETLLRDEALRRRMGIEGRKKVDKNYSLQVQGPRVAQRIREIAECRRR